MLKQYGNLLSTFGRKTIFFLNTNYTKKFGQTYCNRRYFKSMSGPRIKIPQGELEGGTALSANGMEYYFFKGIPFAKPPIGELRFKDPLPPEKWEGVRDATKEGNICPQMCGPNEIAGDEDCLYLNIFTPSLDENKKLPVFVWIHGGAFITGNGNRAIPMHMIEKDVVIVYINYRLSVLGFLCAHDPEFPGNAGLKDQVLSLRWIQKNIAHFGGDPDNVTIAGGSAGGASVHLLTLSPMTKGLIHKAIIQSGSALCPWAINLNPIQSLNNLAAILKITANDSKEIVKSLQKVPVDTLIPAAMKSMSKEEMYKFLPGTFLPTVETEFPGIENLITVHPTEIIRQGLYTDMPILAGFSTYESVVVLETMNFDIERCADIINDLRYFIPPPLNLSIDSPEAHKIANQIKQLYFGEQEIGKETIHSIIHLMSDYMFKHGTDVMLKKLLKNSKHPLYYYEFVHLGNYTKFASMLKQLNLKNAGHSDENGYLFSYKTLNDVTPSPEDVLVRDKLIKMWTDFTRTGNPTPVVDDLITVSWKPITAESLNYMTIGRDLQMGVDPNQEKLKFWYQMYD